MPTSELPAVQDFSWTVGANGTVIGAVIPFESGMPMTTEPERQVGVLFSMLRRALAANDCPAEALLQAIFYITDMSLRDRINEYWNAWPGHADISRAVIGVCELAVPGLAIEATFTATKEV